MSVRVVWAVAAGLLAALATIVLTDIVRLIPIPEKMSGLTAADTRQHILGAVAFGTLLGGFLAAAGSLAKGAAATVRIVGIALPIGAAVAFVGVNFGMAAMAPLYADPARNTAQFLGNVLARGIAWAVIGGWVGAGDGLRQRSVPILRNGLIGGLAGGFAGGVLFEILPWLMPGLRTGAPSRLVGFGATGALIGLLTGLVRELFSEAWVRVVVGKNETKDILLERLENTVGRHELCDIPLHGDPSIARRHAVLRRTPAGWEVVPDPSAGPVSVNNTPVAGPTSLRSGTRIRIGGKELIFEERKVRVPTAGTPREPSSNRSSGVPTPAPPGAPTTGFPSVSVPTAPTLSVGAARLTALSGPHAGSVYPLSDGTVAGRDTACGIALPADTKASRRHAVFTVAAGAWSVADQNSTNGTWVNGQRVGQLALVPGDTVVVGETALRFDG